MTTYEPSTEDGRIAFDAIAANCARHATVVKQEYPAWTFGWSCQCGAGHRATDKGTASYEAHQHEDRARATAVLGALFKAGRLVTPESIDACRREGWTEAVEALRAEQARQAGLPLVAAAYDVAARYLSSIMGGTSEATE